MSASAEKREKSENLAGLQGKTGVFTLFCA
jgi:hypothetical protein